MERPGIIGALQSGEKPPDMLFNNLIRKFVWVLASRFAITNRQKSK